MHRPKGPFREDGEGISSMLDAIMVILIVTIAIVGVWSVSFSGWSRADMQQNDYDIHFSSLALNRYLQSTIPRVTIVEPSGDVVTLEDLKVIELLSLELILEKRGYSPATFKELHDILEAQMDHLILPDHEWAMVAFESSKLPTTGVDPVIEDPFLFQTSMGSKVHDWDDVFDVGEVFTSSFHYSVPKELTGDLQSVEMMINLAIWAP